MYHALIIITILCYVLGLGFYGLISNTYIKFILYIVLTMLYITIYYSYWLSDNPTAKIQFIELNQGVISENYKRFN